MENQNPNNNQPNLTETTPLNTWSGSPIWIQGYILREVSRSTPGYSQDGLIPIRVFFDPEDGRILTNTLPLELRAEYEGKSIQEIQKSSIPPKETIKKEKEANPWDQPWDYEPSTTSQPNSNDNTPPSNFWSK